MDEIFYYKLIEKSVPTAVQFAIYAAGFFNPTSLASLDGDQEEFDEFILTVETIIKKLANGTVTIQNYYDVPRYASNLYPIATSAAQGMVAVSRDGNFKLGKGIISCIAKMAQDVKAILERNKAVEEIKKHYPEILQEDKHFQIYFRARDNAAVVFCPLCREGIVLSGLKIGNHIQHCNFSHKK